MAKVFTSPAIDKIEVAIGAQKLGRIFLDLGYITPAQLNRALAYQREKGGRLGWILTSLRYISRLELYEGLAKHFSLPFEQDKDTIRRRLDRKLARRLTHEEMTRFQAMPYYRIGDTLKIITAEPGSHKHDEFLRIRFGVAEIESIVVTDLDFLKLSEELHRADILDTSIRGLLNRNPEESAYSVFTREQIAFAAGFVCMLGLLLYIDFPSTVVAVLFAVQVFFAVPILFKLLLVVSGKLKHPQAGKPAKVYTEREWPIYTILIAAYKEQKVIANLMQSIKRLDYPEDKLDIILLLEENDKETLEAAKAENAPPYWRFIICPDSLPRTKPKALNFGLNFARGEYLTIYDAEDMPEPQQLKKAVTAFRTHANNYICFQAALNYFNKNENFLTKMFTLEYSSWFDCLLPGLFRLGLPIPLGGTSNHFDVKKLRKIGSWDPYNVTEDADLGIRASMEGYKVGVIDSTTYEEANSRLKNWTRQRSRWVKGYMQTFLVHSRHPLKSLKTLGPVKWLSYTLLIGGTPATFLLTPVMWLLFILSIFLDVSGLFHVPNWLVYFAGFNLIAGNAIVILIAMLGAVPRRNWQLIPLALLSPVYWMLQSVGAYKGLWQLVTRPHYWEKTEHGITKNVPVSRMPEVPGNLPEMVVVRENTK